MILDIEKYPEFVPWCLDGKIHRKNEMKDMIEIEADLTVGKKFLNQTYKSHVTYYKEKGKIIEVIEKGYLLGEKVIRYAKVVVAN